MMGFGFIGQELYASTAQESTTTSSAMSQQQAPTPTYIAVDNHMTDADAAHNTILVGLLIALVAASVALGGLAIYCLRRRAQRRLQGGYQAELRAVQRDKDEEERAARGA